MSNLCIIPARAGSKRIPRKNIKDFLGKPIIAYSIETALKSGLFDEVMVSTDDEEIAKISKQYGASVPFFRSNEAANDEAPLADVIEEVKLLYGQKNKDFTNICCILPTAPLITVDLLKEGLNHLKNNPQLCSTKPIVRFSYPIQRALIFKGDKSEVTMVNPEHKLTRSQDLTPTFHDAGCFYWMKFEDGLKKEPKGGFEIKPIFVQDIDNNEDWDIAEFKYKFLNSAKRN